MLRALRIVHSLGFVKTPYYPSGSRELHLGKTSIVWQEIGSLLSRNRRKEDLEGRGICTLKKSALVALKAKWIGYLYLKPWGFL
jgi:hypothetical protein